MGDRCDVTIRIGGKVERDKLGPLVDALVDERCQTEGWDHFINAEHVREYIDETAADNLRAEKLLLISAGDANYGDLPRVEAELRRLGLSYRKSNSAGSEYPAAITYWHPGMDAPATWEGVDAPTLLVSEIRRLLNSGELAGELDRVESMEKLPPFELTGNYWLAELPTSAFGEAWHFRDARLPHPIYSKGYRTEAGARRAMTRAAHAEVTAQQ